MSYKLCHSYFAYSDIHKNPDTGMCWISGPNRLSRLGSNACLEFPSKYVVLVRPNVKVPNFSAHGSLFSEVYIDIAAFSEVRTYHNNIENFDNGYHIVDTETDTVLPLQQCSDETLPEIREFKENMWRLNVAVGDVLDPVALAARDSIPRFNFTYQGIFVECTGWTGAVHKPQRIWITLYKSWDENTGPHFSNTEQIISVEVPGVRCYFSGKKPTGNIYTVLNFARNFILSYQNIVSPNSSNQS